jgi:hypothetical protein
MPRTKKSLLEFGLNAALPSKCPAAFGARLIYPDDMLWDRKSWHNRDSRFGDRLALWLSTGALRTALDNIEHSIRPNGDKDVVLHEDRVGKIVGNANASHGYVYIAAFLQEVK